MRDLAVLSAAQLKSDGIDASELRRRGYPIEQLRHRKLFSSTELQSAGFSVSQLKHVGISAQRMRAAGVLASELHAKGRFSVSELRSAGIPAEELRASGISPQELAGAGYSASELKGLGLTAAKLRAAGVSLGELRDAGFSLRALKKAGFEWHSFYLWCDVGCADLRELGFLTGSELRRFFEEHSAETLAAGVPITELLECGVTPIQLRYWGGCSLIDLRGAGVSASTLRHDCNFKPYDFYKSGFNVEELRAADFTDLDLQAAGINPPKDKGKKGSKKKGSSTQDPSAKKGTDSKKPKLLPGLLG